jgi:hypothetical protein
MTDFKTKAKIINEFVLNEHGNPTWQEWFEKNDIGVPLSFFESNDLAKATPLGATAVEETWLDLCKVTMADPDGDYTQLEDMLLNFIDPLADDEE